MYNEYEASEVVEVGKAEETILGEKLHIRADEPGAGDPLFKNPFPEAEYDE